MDTLDTRALEEKIDHLIRICSRLADENRALRDQQNSLIAERAALVEKSELGAIAGRSDDLALACNGGRALERRP